MDMIRYEHPELFVLFLLLPFMAVLFLLARWLRRRALGRFAGAEQVSKLMPWASPSRPWIKFFMFLLAFSAVIMAAINPQTGSRMEEAHRKGIELVVALDVSRSMLAQDVRPSRLERARLAVNRLIDQLEQDRFALVLFAGSAHTQVPLTSDYRAARMLLRSAGTESVAVQGTDIGRALQRSIASFSSREGPERVIILLSDGESHEGDPLHYARLASEQGIVIHTVGVGSREGAPIPIRENGSTRGFLRDREGNTVISRYDEALMRSLAEETGGLFRHGSGADMGLDDILGHIRSLEREAYESKVFAEYESRYRLFVILALILLVADWLMPDRRSPWLNSEKIFGTR